jgi:multicomponent Na+:H+ antiporter subunit C
MIVDDVTIFVISRINYWVYVVLMLIGLYGIILKNNYIKKIIGLGILQTAVILLFISIGAKRNATIPIIEHSDIADGAVRAINFINPLPHVLMLTAIVVAVATLGVALALAVKIYSLYNTLDEDELRERLRAERGG